MRQILFLGVRIYNNGFYKVLYEAEFDVIGWK